MYQFISNASLSSILWWNVYDVNFFGTKHGKGEHDGQVVIVRNMFKHHQLKGTKLWFDQAENVMVHCRATLMIQS